MPRLHGANRSGGDGNLRRLRRELTAAINEALTLLAAQGREQDTRGRCMRDKGTALAKEVMTLKRLRKEQGSACATTSRVAGASRLEIAVDDADVVQVGEALGDLVRHLGLLRERQLPVPGGSQTQICLATHRTKACR